MFSFELDHFYDEICNFMTYKNTIATFKETRSVVWKRSNDGKKMGENSSLCVHRLKHGFLLLLLFFLRYVPSEIDDCLSSRSGLNIPKASDFNFLASVTVIVQNRSTLRVCALLRSMSINSIVQASDVKYLRFAFMLSARADRWLCPKFVRTKLDWDV